MTRGEGRKNRGDDQRGSGRMPLENVASERAVLGAIIKDSGIFWDYRLSLTPDLFVLKMHQRILAAMVSLADENRSLNIPGIISRIAVDDDTSPDGYVAMLIAEEATSGEAIDLLSDLIEMRARRKMARFGEQLIRAATEEGQEAATTRIENAIERAKAIAAESDTDLTSADIEVKRVLDEAAHAYKTKASRGIPWFIQAPQRVLGDALEPGWLIGLLADPAGGKTSFALQQAYATASGNGGKTEPMPVIFFSGDQTPADCYRQIASQQLRIESGDIRHGRLDPSEYARLDEFLHRVKRMPLEIRRMGRVRTRDISYRVREFRRKHSKPGLVMIDHAKRIAFDDPRGGIAEGVNQVYGDLKALMLSTDCSGLLLMQRNSEGAKRDNHRPVRGDAYGGEGAMESLDACIALFIEENWIEQEMKGLKNPKLLDELQQRLLAVEGKGELIGLKARFSKANRSEMVRREARFTLVHPLDDAQQQADLLE